MGACCLLVVSQHKLRLLFCHLGIRSCESEKTTVVSALLVAQHGDCFGLRETMEIILDCGREDGMLLEKMMGIRPHSCIS